MKTEENLDRQTKVFVKQQKLDSLQALRAIAFLGVFAFHTNIRFFSSLGRWGVSVFFILSGF